MEVARVQSSRAKTQIQLTSQDNVNHEPWPVAPVGWQRTLALNVQKAAYE